MHRRSLLLLGLLGASAPLWGAGQDPVESVMWDYFHTRSHLYPTYELARLPRVDGAAQ